MPYELEDESGTLEIDMNEKSVKGKCKAKNFGKQIEKLKGVFR